MPYNVPEEEKPAFNKQTQKGLELLTQGVSDTLSRVQSLQQQTLVDAYNQPVQAPVTRDLTPLEQYVYEPQPVQEVADLAAPPTRESMVAPQEQPQVLSNFRNQAEAQFGGDMVSITPEQQASTDIIGAEIDSLRNDAGEISSSPLEVFSKPLDANKVKALGFVDSDGNVTETGELFFNLKEAGVFNEDGTINEKGQAYLIPRSELKKPENNRAFKVWYDDNLDEPEAKDGEAFDAVVGFGKNLFSGVYGLYKTTKKLTSIRGLADIARQTVAGKETVAELQVDQIAALEQVAKNFQAVGGYADILQGLAGRALYEGAAAATGVPMQDMKDAAEENLYLARQRQWTANENLRDLEVGAIAEAMTGLDGFTKVAQEAKNVLGEERFNSRYAGSSAITELVGDPANLMPAAKAFKVATSAPIASRAIIKAQQILGRTAQIEKALNEAQTIVEAGNAILKKEAVAVPLAQRLFTDISARAGANPELLARSQQAMDVAQRITASADEVRAAMPSAIASVEQLAAKRASLATRIPEEYAKKVVQTAELGAKVRAMPANVIGSILERTGDNISKIDNAVTGYLSERGLDQAYNAALGAAGVVGLAGNPVVGAIGAGAAALKTGKFLTEYGKIFKYVGREMENARGQIPFWKRVAYHTAPKSLGQGLSHTFNIFELGGATSDILRRTGRGIVAAYPSDLFFEYLSDGGEMRPQTMTRAAAESFVLGGAFAAGGGAFMGTKQRMRELAIGDEINFRQGLVDTNQKARFEALPPVIKRSIATYSMANPTLNYNFIESGGSEYDPNSNTANINIYSTNPLKALVAHETLHHTIIKNNMEGGIAAMFLGDTKTDSVGGLFRSKGGKLDPEFEAFANKYYDRMRASGMSDAEIKTTYPLEKAAVEYFIEQHSDQYAAMAESGELGAIAARGEVRKKLGSVLETILPKIPVLRDLHFKSGGAIDANGAFVTGVGILGDFGVSQNPIAKKMFREMNKRSSGMMPGQFEPLLSDKEGSGAPLFFDPANEIDVEMMHPMIQVDANDKPILKDGRPIALAKEIDMNRAIAGLSIVEAYRKLRDSNYAPEEGEAYVDEDGEFKPGWVSDSVLTQMFAKHQFNNEQKRMIRQTNKMVKEGNGQRMVMINFPSTTRNKAGKVVYKTQGATIRDTVPVAITIGKDGQVLYGLMSVTKLQENIKKRAQSKRGKQLYSGNIDIILRDVQAMMNFHKKGEDSINWFIEKYGIVEADKRRKFINTMFGLLNKKEQAVLNPMLLEDGVKSSDNVYRTYRADRVSKAIPMSPDEYAAMPFSYEAVSQVRMPEQRQMPEVAVVPERFTGSKEDIDRRGKYVEPPGFFKRFNIDSYERGGRFFDASNGEDLTGKQYATGSIDVSTGKPRLFVDNISDVTKSGAKFKTNLFKQSAGWKWTSENPPSTSTIVSVEGQGKHVYSLKANFESGVELARYSEKKSEPRLRPTAYGELKLGNQVGEISIRGKLHPVYDSIGVTSKAQGSRLMPEVSPEDLNPVANKQEAQGLWADGKRMFALNEMDEKLTPITSKAMLDSYSADAIGWMEPEQSPAPSQRLMPEKIDADYMKAVESGDVEAQQRIVDEAFYKKDAPWGKIDLSTRKSGRLRSEMFRAVDSSRPGDTAIGVGMYLSDEEGASSYGNDVRRFFVDGKFAGVNSPEFELIRKRANFTIGLDEGMAEAITRVAIEKGYDGIRGDRFFGTVVFDPSQIKSADPITRDDSGNIIPPSKRFDITSKDLRFMPEKDSGAVDLMSQTSLNGDPFMIMSAKWGTPKQTSQTVSQSSKPENHIVGLSRIKGLMSAKDLTPKQKASLDDFLVKTASFATDSPGFRDLGTPQTKEEALTVIAKVVDRMARNLLAIYDAVPPPIRSYWQRWYPLAYNWNQEQAKNYSITRQVVAGINARLSPGKDWIHNVNMTERILKAFSDDVVMTKEIEDGAMPIIDSALETKLNTRENKNKPKEWVAEQKEKAKAAKLGLQKMIGLKLSQMTDAQAAQLIRYYTQVVGDNRVLNYFEQGTPVYADSISWQSFSNLEKAINMYRNPSMKNISENMGSDHKIRSFFNNQESPNDPVLRDVTSDTHAVAAAYLLPLSQSSQQVSRNFGGASNAVSGLNGMYYIVADAYRKAADARGVEPRAMQSITWEGARSMFPRGFKKAENVKKVESIWNRFERKEITKSQALQEINQLLIDFFAKNPNSRPRFAVLPRQ